jgi:phospholipid transport system substrate-binding protein
MKKLFFVAAALLSFAGSIVLSSPAPAYAAAEKEATLYVQDLGTQAIDIISDKQAAKPQKATALQALFNNSVDFPWVARFVIGRYWREASEQQRQRYTQTYQKFQVHHYSSLFADYTGGSFKILYTRNDGDGEYTVGMQIQGGNNGEPVLIDYKIRDNGKRSFQVFDVIIEGVSMLTTQRSEFSSIVGSKGLDYLIDQLEKKTASIN